MTREQILRINQLLLQLKQSHEAGQAEEVLKFLAAIAILYGPNDPPKKTQKGKYLYGTLQTNPITKDRDPE